MHDIGKLGVSTKILAKPGKLADEEYEHMKQHPVRGYEIVLGDRLLQGRPRKRPSDTITNGWTGEVIPMGSSVNDPRDRSDRDVCDAFDSMTSTRVYRKAKGIEEAIVELHRCVGTQFDPESLAALEKAIAREGWEPNPSLERRRGDPCRPRHRPLRRAACSASPPSPTWQLSPPSAGADHVVVGFGKDWPPRTREP